jgi:aspartate 1-decarboxylase
MRIMLKSKIHRATVTESHLEYEGSLTIDSDLLEAADILPYEQIHVWNVSNGHRLITYALPGEAGSGVVCVNGAGAHLVRPGDKVIIATYTQMKNKPARRHQPLVILVDDRNRIREPQKTSKDKGE